MREDGKIAEPATEEPSVAKKSGLGFRNRNDFILVFILVGLVVLFDVMNPLFLSVSNIRTLITAISLQGCLVLGMTLVILTAGIDLSIGAIMAMSTVVSAQYLNSGGNWFAAILITLALGSLVGFVNGALVAKARMPALIVTLATMTISRGVAILIKGGYGIMIENKQFIGIGSDLNLGVFSVPLPFIIFLVFFALCILILHRTTFGLSIYAIGSNREGAILSGIRANRVTLLAYVVSGFFAGLSGLFTAAYVASAQPSSGIGVELSIISAVVLGGVSLFGGQGKVILAVCGFITITALVNGLTLLGVGSDIQYVISGIVLLGAVFLSMTLTNNSRK